MTLMIKKLKNFLALKNNNALIETDGSEESCIGHFCLLNN
ncbi:hypothetical protein RICGR_0475 [Rickettsiella grylli]|uniref:Uncharacterized protein n=1 Tax=Rickettsiella grylli TaxID=59196 RepID=A8PLM3_9COXI|nr:hypothetical protein RICGR_0475 [Rickettsiella grylli]